MAASILVVDDEWTTRLEVEEMLTSLGYTVAGLAESGQEAVEMARSLSPDLILMDIVMPGSMSGIQAAEKIKSASDVAIVFISGHGDPEYIQKAKQIEPFGYVMKPFDEREVHAFVEIALHKRKMELKLKRTLERLKKTNRELKQEIRDRKRCEAQMLESQKREAISTLAGGIAHQFNNALTPIIGHVGLLEMEHFENMETMKSLKDIETSSQRMAHLTHQLLAYARGGKYNAQTLCLNDFVTDTLALLEHSLDPLVRVETDLPEDVMHVKADPTQMQTVFSALMANSNEAIEGPGRIRISTGNVDVDRQFVRDHPGLSASPHICLTVEDDGKGMDEETRQRIFEPFFTTHFMGRGLGMAAAYGIVSNHDGAITVSSEPGQGTAVRIYLPAVAPVMRENAAPPAETRLTAGKGTILVIEDEEMVMDLTVAALERLRYRVLGAETGQEGLEISRSFEGDIDLTLLDIKLADTSGTLLYPLLKEARPNTKVIVCSGYPINGAAREILDAGAEDFIQKPFSISTLAAKLTEVLEGKQAVDCL